MPKITFMGAGSSVFAKNVLGDCMTSPIMENSDIALYDIDAHRLDEQLSHARRPSTATLATRPTSRNTWA